MARTVPKICMILLSAILILPALSSCSDGKRADQVFDLCFQSSTGTEEAIKRLQGVSDRFGYSFRDSGNEAKSGLEAIKADRSILPAGRPVQADIERKDGAILLIASNFGNAGPMLRLSFFYQKNEGENSPFFRTLLSELSSMPATHLSRRRDEDGSSRLCQTNVAGAGKGS